MRDLDVAHVAHCTPTRLRLRVLARRHDAPFFDNLVKQFANQEALIQVEANPLTASVILRSRHPIDWSTVDLAPYGLALPHVVAGQAPEQALSVAFRITPVPSATGAHFPAAPELAALAAQLISSLLTGRLLAALLQWVSERLLRSLLSHLLVSPGHA